MKRFLTLVAILGFSVWAGLKIHNDPGYALFAYRHWTIEMPLWFAIIVILFGFCIFYVFLRLISNTSSLGGRLRAWMGRRRTQLSQNLTSRGLIELAEGHFSLAEKYLIRAVSKSETPLINYLSAARAAQEQGAYERRDEYLRMAHYTTPDAKVAISVVQAELQLSDNQLEHALATLRHLREISPNHKYVLKLLMNVYQKLGDWSNLADLLPDLRKNKVLNSKEAHDLHLRIYQELLTSVARHTDLETLTSFWERVPREFQRNPQLLCLYIPNLIEKGGHNDAESLLREALKKNWDDDLVYWYGCAQSSDPMKQLTTAESWLKTRANNSYLLLTLGRLCVRNQLWGKARSYFETSLHLNPRPEIYKELGELVEQLGENEVATGYYRKGLLMVASD